MSLKVILSDQHLLALRGGSLTTGGGGLKNRAKCVSVILRSPLSEGIEFCDPPYIRDVKFCDPPSHVPL